MALIKYHETDRLHALITELRRAGITAEEMPDGLQFSPASPTPLSRKPDHDHRMAMALSLLGLRTGGICIK